MQIILGDAVVLQVLLGLLNEDVVVRVWTLGDRKLTISCYKETQW